MNKPAVVRAQTVEFLRRNPNFGKLSSAQQAETIRAMSTIVETMAATGRGADPYSPHAIGLDAAPTNGIQTVSGGAKEAIAAQGGGQVGSVIGAGVTQASRMVKEINFPQFVASLIDGTFKAIVTSSIEQMKAYAEMVKSVSASLNDFKDKNTTDEEAQQSLVSRYPQLMQLSIVDGAQKVIPRDDAFDADLPDFGADLGMGENVTSLDEDTIAEKLVPAARDDLARGRQQLLATTILMGINRIIVTDGRINARIRFTFTANETTTTHSTARDLASMGDTVATQGQTTESGTSDQKGGWFNNSRTTGSDYQYNSSTQTVTTPNIQVTSEMVTDTNGSIKAGGEMFGEVSINFRSETFPLEKMVDTDQMMRLNQAQAGFRAVPQQPGAAATPAAAATPTSTPSVAKA
ncbi:MAG: hypothetical protein QM831_26970 [Kofleriaceae bacterium]